MERQRPFEDDRVKHIALELLHPHHHRQNDQRIGHTAVHERHRHCQQARHEGTDDREETADEHHRHQREHERSADQRQTDPDEHGIDQADQRQASHISGQGSPGCLQTPARPLGVGHALEQGTERTIAVLQVEERDQQGEHQAGDDLEGNGGPAEHAGGDRPGVGANLFDRLIDVVLDVGLRQPQRPFAQPFGGGLHRLLKRQAQRLDPVGERRDEQEHKPGHQRDETENGAPGGQRRRPSTRLQTLDDGTEDRGGEQPENDGKHDHLHDHNRLERDVDGRQEQQVAPAEGRRPVQPARGGCVCHGESICRLTVAGESD